MLSMPTPPHPTPTPPYPTLNCTPLVDRLAGYPTHTHACNYAHLVDRLAGHPEALLQLPHARLIPLHVQAQASIDLVCSNAARACRGEAQVWGG